MTVELLDSLLLNPFDLRSEVHKLRLYLLVFFFQVVNLVQFRLDLINLGDDRITVEVAPGSHWVSCRIGSVRCPPARDVADGVDSNVEACVFETIHEVLPGLAVVLSASENGASAPLEIGEFTEMEVASRYSRRRD